MAESLPETPTATQKRPLEEPSSPSGPNDQPEAKRPALDKVSLEDGADTADVDGDPAIAAEESTTNGEPGLENTAVEDNAIGVVDEPEVTDGEGDTIVPDAPEQSNPPVGSPQTQAPSTVKPANGASSGRAGSQAPAPYQRQDETEWLHVRAIISSAEAATVIGKGGENVSIIRKLAGAKCTVSEYSRGAVERILTVSGLVDAVAKAFGLIIRTLNQEDLESASTPQSKTYPLRLLVPSCLIGSIIGKGGKNIREIQEASGARLNASEQQLPNSSERSLVILGVADAVHIATYYVGSTLYDQLVERFGGPAASAYAVRHGGPQGPVPGGLQVVPYIPQHAGGQTGHPERYRQHSHQPQHSPSSPYGMPYTPGQSAQPLAPTPVQFGAGPPRPSYAGAGPHVPQPSYGHGPPNAAHAGPPQQPVQSMVGQPITQQIFIPNDMVGAIIGKGGAKINEIRQLSGSVIKINEPQDNNNERLVTITGTQECNQMALYMLYSRLGESSKNSSAITPR